MSILPHREEIKKAFFTLFGPQITFSDAVLNYIQPSGIKSAFREQVKVFHPDLAAKGGISEAEAKTKFQELYSAYRLLLDMKTSRMSHTFFKHCTATSTTGTHRQYAQGKAPGSGDFYYSGSFLPNYPLRLGEFLFYSKVISWCTLIAAIVYKRKADDKKMGQYFLQNDIITEKDLFRYLSLQKSHNRRIEEKKT